MEGKAPKSDGIIQESLRIHLIDGKRILRKGSDTEYDFEENFKHGGRKRHKIITPTNIRVSLRDEFFNDIESCSVESTNLDEVALFIFASATLNFMRDDILGLVFPPSALFFFPTLLSLTWCRRLHLLLMRIL